MDLREELIQGLLKEYAALGRIREKLAIQLEALGVNVSAMPPVPTNEFRVPPRTN